MPASEERRVYLLGDQTFDYASSLASLFRSDNPHLIRLFRECYAALRVGLGRLPLHTCDSTPKITSLADLLTRKQDGCISPALDQVLSLVHLFASFIWCVSLVTIQVTLARADRMQATFDW